MDLEKFIPPAAKFQTKFLVQMSRNDAVEWGPRAARVPFSAARRKPRHTNFLRAIW